jgi:hypothetical protein
MAGWTEPATAAAKCQYIFMVAVRAFNAGEPFMETATFKILANHM